MFANLQNDAETYSSNAYIENSSVVVEYNLSAPMEEKQFYRGGVVGYTSDDDLRYDGVSAYINGKLDSPTESPELFGGLIGCNTANGMYMNIYIFADMSFFGYSTTAAGLIGIIDLHTDKELLIQFCVMNLNFTGSISNDANIAGIIGKSVGNTKISDCQSHGIFNFSIIDFEKGYIAFTGGLGYTDNSTHLMKVYSTIAMTI